MATALVPAMVAAASASRTAPLHRTQVEPSAPTPAPESAPRRLSLAQGTDAVVGRPTDASRSFAMQERRAADGRVRAQLEGRLNAVRNDPTLQPLATTTPPRTAQPAAQPVAPTATPAPTYPADVQAVVDLVRTGTVDDATRTALGDQFAAMDAATSHAAMEAIRAEGLQDVFLDQVLRDDAGNAVDPRIKTAVGDMMNTGRLDVYAETLASTSYNLHDPTTSGRSDEPHFAPSDNGIYFTDAQLNDTGLSATMAHETFHAFSNHHGGPSYSAIDEGMGISVIHYAFENGDYSTSEAVYGTANFYRDSGRDPNYTIGSFQNADPKLASLLDGIQSRDRSEFDWRDDAQIQQDYTDHWEQYDRFEDLDGNGDADWLQPGGYAEQAEAAQLAAHAAPPPSGNPVINFFKWLLGL